MGLPAYNATAVDQRGKPMRLPRVYVTRRDPAGPVPSLYEDRDGTIPLGNPFTAMAGYGQIFFHVESGVYKVTVSSTDAVNDLHPFSRVFDWVEIGTPEPVIIDADPALTFPPGRLSLTSGVFLPTSDVAGSTTVYYVTGGRGRYAPIYDGTAFVMADIGADQLSFALDSDSGHAGYHQADRNFDFWFAHAAGTNYFGTGPSWNSGAVAGSDIARGTGAGSTEDELFQGFLVNKNSMTLRHGSASGDTVTIPARQAVLLGGARMTANGQTEDSQAKRFLWNAYNAVPRKLKRVEGTDSWPYSAFAFQQARASSDNKVEVFRGLTGPLVRVSVQGHARNSTSTFRNVTVGVGVGSSTVNSADIVRRQGGNDTLIGTPSAEYFNEPGLGYKEFRWLENGAGSDTQTWFGDSGDASLIQSGMTGEVWA